MSVADLLENKESITSLINMLRLFVLQAAKKTATCTFGLGIFS